MNYTAILYTVSASLISAAIIYAFNVWRQDRKERRKAQKFINILLYSSIHASEKVVGEEWKKAHDDKKDDLIEKEDFVHKA